MERTSSKASSGSKKRQTFLLVGMGLLGLVAALLLGAFLLSDRLRSQPGIDPVPAIAANTKPSQGAAALRQPVAPTTGTSPTVGNAPSSVSDGAAADPSAADSPLEHEIEAAYLHYWDVRAQAYLNLDTSNLGEVMAGAELARAEVQIRQLEAQGRAGKIDVEHRIAFVKESATEAEVYDEYLNRSVFLDAVTKQEIPTKEPPSVEKVSFILKKTDGAWKVVDGTQHN